MTEIQTAKQYDLEDRTLAFAKRVRALIKSLPLTLALTAALVSCRAMGDRDVPSFRHGVVVSACSLASLTGLLRSHTVLPLEILGLLPRPQPSSSH